VRTVVAEVHRAERVGREGCVQRSVYSCSHDVERLFVTGNQHANPEPATEGRVEESGQGMFEC
jgi:hypothetical protein